MNKIVASDTHTSLTAIRTIFVPHLLVLPGYLLVSIALTWPLILHWNTAIVGGTGGFFYGGSFGDASQNVWNMWWVRSAFERGQNPFWSDMLYYPEGVQMYLQTMNITNAFLTLPIQYLSGPVAAYNTAVLLAFTLTGYTGFLLVRAFVPGLYIPFLCGLLLTACPFHVFKLQVNQMNLMSMQWLILYFLALIWLEQRAGWRWIAWAVICITLVVLTDWYWALLCAIYTAVWVTLSLFRSQAHWILLRRYGFFCLSVLLCLSPLLFGMLRVRTSLPTGMTHDPHWEGYTSGFSADALGLFFPSVHQPLWGTWAQQWTQSLSPPYGSDGWYIAAGWVLLVCAGMGIWLRWRAYWQLLLVGGVAWAFSLGPTLRIAGSDTGLPMPFTLIQHLPLISAGRRPSHLAVITIVLATVFAGIGLHTISQHRSQRWRTLFLGSITILALIEFWPPHRNLYQLEQPRVYQHLSHAAPGAVADLPMAWKESARTLRNQMVHRHPILGGFVARWPAYDSFFIPHINQIGHMRHDADIVPVSHTALAAMQCYAPLRHVVVKKDQLGSNRLPELQLLLRTLNDAPVQASYEDDVYVWYELPLFPDACQPFVYLGQGWYDVEGTDGTYWRWASAENDIWLVNPFDMPLEGQLEIEMDSFASPRLVELWHEENRMVQWYAGDMPRRVQVRVNLLPGRNRLLLRAEPWVERDQISERLLTVPVRSILLHMDRDSEQ